MTAKSAAKKSPVAQACANGVHRPTTGAGGPSFKPLKAQVRKGPPAYQLRNKKRDEKRQLVAQARKETGRAHMGWKATKKYARRLELRAKRKLQQ